MRKAAPILAIAGLFSVTAPALAEPVPFHTFGFSAKAGYLEEDVEIVGQKAMAGASIYGQVLIVRCQDTEEFAAGFRIEITPADKSAAYYVGFQCDPETGLLEAGFHHTGDGPAGERIVIDSVGGSAIGKRGEKVDFTLDVSGSHLKATFGGYAFERKLEFEPAEMHYVGFGTSGMAKFYEKIEAIS